MPFVFLPAFSGPKPKSNVIAKSHVAKLAANNRRLKKHQQAIDCLNGAPLPPNQLLVVNLSKQSSRPTRDEEELEQWTLPPMTLLNKGNSDPFNASVLVIDATANELLVFNRECLVPWINSTEEGQEHTTSYSNKFVKNTVESLHDERVAHASLAALAMVVANSTGNRTMRAYGLRLVGQAYGDLQKHFLQRSNNDQDAILRIFAIFLFELVARNPQAAAIHMQALHNKLLEQKQQGRAIDPQLISAAGWNDNIRCLRYLAPPIFDAEVLLEWEVLDEINCFAQRLDEHGLLESEPPNLFDGNGFPPRVKALASRFMYLIRLSQGFAVSSLHLTTELTKLSWSQNAGLLANRLHALFHDAQRSLTLGLGESQLLRREMATSLALLYWAFAVSNFEFLDPKNAHLWKYDYPTTAISSAMLDALSQQIYAISWSRREDAPLSLRLWLLYTATLAEQALAHFTRTATGHRSKHNVELVMQAVHMGLWDWESVHLELEKYLCFPDRGPASKPWFEQALKEYLTGLTPPSPPLTFSPKTLGWSPIFDTAVSPPSSEAWSMTIDPTKP